MGTTGGNTNDLLESLELTEKGLIDPAVMLTHIGGIDTAAQTTLNLPTISGGKKRIYNHINMPLTAISDFEELGKENEHFAKLGEIVKNNRGLWCLEAEKYLLKNWS